jgi:hypothetical protein
VGATSGAGGRGSGAGPVAVRPALVRFALAAAGLLVLLAATTLVARTLATPLGLVCGVGVALWLPGWVAAGVLRVDALLGPVAAVAVAPLLGLLVWSLPAAAGLALGLPFLVVCALVLAGTATLRTRGPAARRPPALDLLWMGALMLAAAFLAWRWQSLLIGDDLFHAGVIRKLLALDGPTFRSIWQFQDGHPHAGYAFPLLHVVQAAAIKLTGADPSRGYEALPAAFGMLVVPPAYALGRTLGGRTAAVITGALAVWIGITGDQAFSVIQQPRYVVTFVVLPVLLLLLLAGVHECPPTLGGLIATAVFLATVLHSTYTPSLVAMLVGVAIVAPRLRRAAAATTGIALATLAIVYVAAVLGGHRGRQPVVPEPQFATLGSKVIALAGSRIIDYRFEFLVALVLLVVALRRPRTPLGVLALAGGIAFLIAATPGVLTVAVAVVGRGQAARAWEEIPWLYLLGPALVALAGTRWAWPLVLPVAAASLYLSEDIKLHSRDLTALTTLAAAAVLVLGVRAVARRGDPWAAAEPGPAGRWLPAVALTAAVVIGPLHKHWDAVDFAVTEGRPQPTLLNRLTPGSIAFLHAHDGDVPIVLAPYWATRADWFSGLSYALVGETTVYTVAVSFIHTASEPKDQAEARRRAAAAFYRPSTREAVRHRILARYHVRYVAIRLRRWITPMQRALRGDPALRVVYADPPGLHPSYARLAILQVDPRRLGAG